MVIGETVAQAADACALTLDQVLGLLARRGTVLVARGSECCVEIWLEAREGATLVGDVDAAIVSEGTRRGWLEGVGNQTGRWRINAAGRAALRKIKSASDDAAAVPHAADFPPPSLVQVGPAQAIAESPLAWLRRRKDKFGQPLISATQFDAGERLRADLWFGDMTPRVTMNWSASGTGGRRHGSGLGVDLLDKTVAAQQRVRDALAAAGPEFAGLLIDVCGHLKGLEDIELARGWPARSAKIVLQLGLNALARHYGLIASSEGEVIGKLRHWGSADYCPSGDAS